MNFRWSFIALIAAVSLVSCDLLFEPTDAASEVLSFSEAITSLPDPQNLGPRSFADARRLRAVAPFDPSLEEDDVSTDIYIDAFLNGGIDKYTASYYSEMRRLLLTLTEEGM